MITLDDALEEIKSRGHELTRFGANDLRGLPYEHTREGFSLDSEYAETGLRDFLKSGRKVCLPSKLIVLEFDQNYIFTLDLENDGLVYDHVNGSDVEIEIMAEYFKQAGFTLKEEENL